jgi:hypothetical protein
MFDFSRLTDTISGFLGGGQDAGQLGGIQEVLQNAGLDPSLLQGLDQAQIFDLLSQYGIDPSQLGADQINELVQNFGVSEHLTNFASEWLGNSKN